jgi:hypothetical protein
MKKFQINSSDMIKLRVYWVALGVMCHVEVMLYSYQITLNNCIYIYNYDVDLLKMSRVMSCVR